MHEKWPAPTKLTSASWILSSGYESFFVWVLRQQKSIQKHRPPSFFQTSTTTLHHALWLGQITPESNISHRYVQTSSTNGRGIHLNHSLNGVLSMTLITCLAEWVQPSSLGSKEKTLWYSAKRDVVESTSSGGQDSNPLKSNSLNNFSCLYFTVSFGVWRPCTLSDASITPVPIGGSGTNVAATALTTEVFFLRVWGYATLFLTTTAAFLLPLHNSV